MPQMFVGEVRFRRNPSSKFAREGSDLCRKEPLNWYLHTPHALSG